MKRDIAVQKGDALRLNYLIARTHTS
jgi:hypothetical protein